jgi:hypothetical protein
VITHPIFFHIGLPKTGTTTIQFITRKDQRINVIGTRHFNRFEYWEKPVTFIKPGKVNLVTEENQVLQMDDFGKFILFLSRIKQFSPDAHIILTLREQRSLLESRYKYQFNWHGGYTKSFDAWLKSGQGMDYLSLCMYDSLYNTLVAFFPVAQIHFLLFEDLKNDFNGFFTSLYKIFELDPPDSLLTEPVVQNKSLSEPELAVIRKLNRFKIFKGDGRMSKYEFALYKRIAATFRDESKKREEFRWEKVPFHERIEADFARENSALVAKNIFTAETLKNYHYLLGAG